jgi:hypothetical protein
MLTLKSSAHLRTNRHRRSFRGCPSSTGVPAWRVEAARHLQEWIGLANRESRRGWLDQLWNAHCRRLASQARSATGVGGGLPGPLAGRQGALRRSGPAQ